ncbi:hypothetical protein ACHABX_03125 [Nesterenkonia halotolerans]|uniref:hypothetical protein n=1 Tax=Nesterenkonia halotolerans TaxID=225325 RepID=UPI003EE710BA
MADAEVVLENAYDYEEMASIGVCEGVAISNPESAYSQLLLESATREDGQLDKVYAENAEADAFQPGDEFLFVQVAYSLFVGCPEETRGYEAWVEETFLDSAIAESDGDSEESRDVAAAPDKTESTEPSTNEAREPAPYEFPESDEDLKALKDRLDHEILASDEYLVQAMMTATAMGGGFENASQFLEEDPGYDPYLHEHAVQATLPICVNLSEGHTVDQAEMAMTAEMVQAVSTAPLSFNDAMTVAEIAMEESACPDEAKSLVGD